MNYVQLYILQLSKVDMLKSPGRVKFTLVVNGARLLRYFDLSEQGDNVQFYIGWKSRFDLSRLRWSTILDKRL